MTPRPTPYAAPSRQLAEETRWLATRLAALFAATTAWLLVATTLRPEQPGWIQAVPSVLVMLGCLAAAATLVIRLRAAIVTPLPLFLGVCGLVFGFGPLFYLFQPDSPYGSARGRLPVGGLDLLRVELLNSVGLLAVSAGLILAASLWLRWRSHPEPHTAVPPDRAPTWPAVSQTYLLRASLVFTAVAIILRAASWSTGTRPAQLLPGFLQLLDHVGALAVLTSAMYAARSGKAIAWTLVLVPLTLEAVNGLLLFRKSRVLFPLLWGCLGACLGGKSWRFLAAAAGAGLLIFAILYPVTSLGRVSVWTDDGLSPVQFYASLLDRGVERTEASSLWFMWARFNYTPVQRAVMREYEEGRPGGTFANLPWLLVPRALAPSKPVLDLGRQVNVLLFDRTTSSTSPTAFGEAYWNGGWLYLVISGLVIGAGIIPVAQISLRLLARPSMAAWAVASYGLSLGLSPQNFFTVAFVGSVITLVSWSAAVWLGLRVTEQLRDRPAS